DPLGLDELDVVVEGEGAAAGGDHGALEVAGGAEDVALALAEVRLTALGEDLLDRELLRRLDQFVEVEEGDVEARRELAPDGGLAGAHEADQVDFHSRPCAPS